ncbi:MAG: PAS domain-containing protein [Terriglobia bacterium]
MLPEVRCRLDLAGALEVMETLSAGVTELTGEVAHLEEALRRNYRMFEALVCSGADGMAITGPDRRIVRVIKGLMGIDHQFLAGAPIESLAVPEDRALIVNAYNRLLSGDATRIALRVRWIRADDSIVSLDARLTDMLDNRDVQGIVWTYSAL